MVVVSEEISRTGVVGRSPCPSASAILAGKSPIALRFVGYDDPVVDDGD
jgi:hypothetical protein